MKLKKILSAILATVMIVTVFGAVAMTASAATSNFTDVEFTVANPIKKTVELPAGATTGPAETYTFTLVPGAAEDNYVGNDNSVPSGQAHSEPVLAGPTLKSGGTYTITYNGTEKGAELVKTVPCVATADFPTPGIYHYVLTETAGSLNYETYSQARYDVYVTIGTNGQVLSCMSRQSHNDAGEETGTKMAPEFVNKIDDTALKVTKTVTGNIGDQEKLFNFTLHTVPNAQYPVGTLINCQLPNDDSITTVAVGTDLTFTLKHGQEANFTNLPISLEYTVTEQDYTADGYTTTVNATPEAQPSNGYVMSAVADSTDDVAAYTNDRSNTDTGVDMGTASGIAMAALSGVSALGVGGWFAIKGRKKNED